MKRVMKKLSVIACAAMVVGAGISGVAIAANNDAPKGQHMERAERDMMPPMMHKAMENLALTDDQKAQLKTLKERQKALRAEFWGVFTEEQKTTMLENMMHHRKDRGDKMHFRKGHHDKGERGEHRQREDKSTDDQ